MAEYSEGLSYIKQFYYQMLKYQIQKSKVYETALPLTEDITKLLYYGIIGNNRDMTN